jgi:hypothetical protein
MSGKCYKALGVRCGEMFVPGIKNRGMTYVDSAGQRTNHKSAGQRCETKREARKIAQTYIDRHLS